MHSPRRDRSDHRARALIAMTALAATLVAGCALGGQDHASPEPAPPSVTSSVSPPPATPPPSASPTDATAAAQVAAHAAGYARVTHEGFDYAVVSLPLAEWDVRIDWDAQAGGTYLSDAADHRDGALIATNAGIFAPGFVPGGLLVSDGEQRRALNLNEGAGNFHLMPNGVFAIYADRTAAVMESSQYDAANVLFATQSGPALVLDGDIHPQFREDSTNLAWRSGVGVSPDGTTVYLVLSLSMVNFHSFARLFHEELGCDDALFLDGNISDMWVDGVRDAQDAYGPYAGIITAAPRD